MKSIPLARLVALAGMVGAATLATVLVPSAAQADVQNPPVGAQPGNLTLNPTSGASTVTPGFSTSTACPAGFQSTAGVDVVANDGSKFGVLSAALPSTILNAPFSGTFGFSMADVLSISGPAGQTYEIVVRCDASLTSSQYVQSTFVTYSANGSSWTSSPTPPGPGPTATTTSLTANTSSATFGTNVIFTATVTPPAATGSVEFFNGTDSLGTIAVSGGQAVKSINTLQVGDHSITAQFIANASYGGSTSNAVLVTITPTGGNTGTETINVNVPLSEGVFTLTVSGTPVQLSDAVNNGTYFQSTGSLSPVTVSDGRQQTKPGWSVSGQVSDFTSGGNSFSGSNLGWTPQVTTQNAASDVVAGPAVAAQTVPGLKGGSGLASATASHGFGTSVLGALLDLRIPVDTPVGSYSALLTVTAITHA